jgi:methylated-DNA-protein-cysteine methyltransferase related protein
VLIPGSPTDGKVPVGAAPPGTFAAMARAVPPNATPWPDDHEPTAFQEAVVDAVARLGPGELITYGEVAEEVGRPGAAQAVANILRSAPGLPWWRVVPAEGRLYRTHAPVQAPLLVAEGHLVDEERRVRAGAGVGRKGGEHTSAPMRPLATRDR